MERQCIYCRQYKVDTEFHLRTNLCKKCHAIKTKEYRYGIDTVRFNQMMERQDGCCAICGKKAKLYIDHEHSSNLNRELLCNNCNLGLGKFNDDPMLMQKAVDYLVKHRRGVKIVG